MIVFGCETVSLKYNRSFYNFIFFCDLLTLLHGARLCAVNVRHRRSQDFVSGGALFLCQKSWRPFFSPRPQRPSKYTSKSNLPSKNCPKNWLLLWLGVHFVSWGGAFTHFPCKLRLKKIFFTALGGAGAPTAPPGSPMMFVEFPAQLLLLYAKWRYNWLCGVNNRRWVCVHALRWYWTLPRSAEFTSCRPVGSLAFIAVMRSIDSRHALYYVDRTNVQSVKQSGDWQNSCPLVIALISLMEQMTNANVIVQ